MDLEDVVQKLRGARRERPVTANEGCPRESADRIRSAIASKWISAVASSCTAVPRRPQSSPAIGRRTPRVDSAGRAAAPSWARGNPYAKKAFPRAKTWTRRGRAAGLSGKRPPSGWDVEAEQEEAALAEKRKKISAKDLYNELVSATARTRGKSKLPGPITSSAAEVTAGESCDGGYPHAPFHDSQAHSQRKARDEDDNDCPVTSAQRNTSAVDVVPDNAPLVPKDEETRGEDLELGVMGSNTAATTGEDLGHEQELQQQQKQQRFQADSSSQRLSQSLTDDDRRDTVAADEMLLGLPQVDAPLYPRKSDLGDAVTINQRMGEGGVSGNRSYSTSAADSVCSSSGSSVSSEEDHSFYEDDSEEAASGILEDPTEGVDSWLEDVHGTGREAFFGLFKCDATPQFCRPSLEVIGRHGIGSNFVDGEPNIKYLPQRPVELHEISASPPSVAPPPETAAFRRRPTPRPASPVRPNSATATSVAVTSANATTADGVVQKSGKPNAQDPSPRARQVRLSTPTENAVTSETQDQQVVPPPPTTASTTAAVARDRPHTSPGMRNGPSGNAHGGGIRPSSTRCSPTGSPTRTRLAGGVQGGSVIEKRNTPKQPTPRRPQTADGRDVEATRYKMPFLDDPHDPVMIAHRMMKRPASPRRDYLMRCAERQLLPVPVINRALRIDPQPAIADPMTGDAGEVHTAGGKPGEAEETNIGGRGGRHQEGQREGCIRLRHYYLGEARARCLRSAITSVPVTLREVELVDSGLDGPASETLLGVLLERAGTISKLDLSGNRIGLKGASGLSRLIAHKRCALRSLKLDGNKAGDHAVITVLKALARYQPPVTHLGLSDNGLTLKVMQECAGPLLTGGLSLLSLDLGWNHLNQQAIEEVSDALAWNKSVTKMNLEFNNSGEGVHALAEALQNNKTLTNLNLTANHVRWEGAIALSEAVVASTNIRNLVLRDNPIGTAAGLQMSIALAEKPGDPCLVDIKGCTCFSDKTDVWSGMKARKGAARAARLALVRARNAAIRARKKLREKEKRDQSSSRTGGKKSGAELDSTGASKGAPQPPKNVPPPLPPPTQPDEHLYWLDLTVDRKWDLRLNRPFDRAVGREVLRTFNFSSGGSLAGILRVPGGAPRQVTFRRREKLQPAPGDATGNGLSSGRGRKSGVVEDGRGPAVGRGKAISNVAVSKGMGKGKARGGTARQREADHPLAKWCGLNEWAERKERGWEGDVPPVQGLTVREEVNKLLAQAS
ncbi:unnamed protein product [Ectocarpus sp. 6 AP-2014]